MQKGQKLTRKLDLNRKCDICNKSFHPVAHNAKRCSKECAYVWFKNNVNERGKRLRRENGPRKKKCVVCKTVFQFAFDSPSTAITCSEVCSRKRHSKKNRDRIKSLAGVDLKNHRAYQNKKQKEYTLKNKQNRKLRKRKCRICKNSFTLIEKANPKTKTCSISCRNKWTRKFQIKWCKNNPDKVNDTQRRYRMKHADDINFRLSKTLRSFLYRILHGRPKTKKFCNYVNYSTQDLRSHLENQFQQGMSWDNHSSDGWHIDHIKPVASFQFINKDNQLDDKQIRECFALSNLRPLWAKENLARKRIRRIQLQ